MAAPTKRFSVGNVTVARFENEVDGPKDKFTAISFTAQKVYKQGSETKYSSSFKANEIPFLLKAFELAYADHYVKPQYNSSEPQTDDCPV